MSNSRNIRGGAELQAFLSQLPAKIEKNIMRAALRQGANVFKDAARDNVPVKLGALKKSIRVSTRGGPGPKKGGKRGTVTATVKAGDKKAWYYHFVEFGTAAHKITAKNGKSLVFQGRQGKVVIKSVNHPGAVVKPFMRPAFDSNINAALNAVGEAIKQRLATKHGIDTAHIDFGVEP